MSDSRYLDAADDESLRASVAAGRPSGVSAKALEVELEQLYRSHYGKVVGYFRRSGQAEALAAELAQETFINAIKGLPQFHGGSKLSTWVWSIARNVLLGHVRASPKVSSAADAELDPDSLADPLSVSEPAHQTLVRNCVRRGFEAFSRDYPDRAQVVYLAVVEGWTRAELAEFLGRSEHAATEYLSQCKARLKPYIEQCHDC